MSRGCVCGGELLVEAIFNGINIKQVICGTMPQIFYLMTSIFSV